MGRAEDRKKSKNIKKKLTDKQYQEMMNSVNKKYLIDEVNAKCNIFSGILLDAVEESLKKNGISNTKISQILRDVELEVLRKENSVG